MNLKLNINHLVLGLSLVTTCSPVFSQTSASPGSIKIFDASLVPQVANMFLPGRLVLVDGVRQKKKNNEKEVQLPKTAVILNENLQKTRDYFNNTHNRRSWDGKGAEILASVNLNKFTIVDLLGMQENAAWTGSRFVFGAGSFWGLDHFEKALDVVGHEYTHAVIDTSSKLAYQGQSGALNEHLADVFGVIINNKNNPDLKNPYFLGEKIMSATHKIEGKLALRDMMDPSRGLVPQPEHMRDLEKAEFSKYKPGCVPTSENDRCGVHILSGIPNKAAALMFSVLGMEKLAPLFYNVMTKRLTSTATFSQYRKALLDECKVLFKSDRDCSVVDSALNQVGIIN